MDVAESRFHRFEVSRNHAFAFAVPVLPQSQYWPDKHWQRNLRAEYKSDESDADAMCECQCHATATWNGVLAPALEPNGYGVGATVAIAASHICITVDKLTIAIVVATANISGKAKSEPLYSTHSAAALAYSRPLFDWHQR